MAGSGDLTIDQLCEAVRNASSVRITGTGSHQHFLPKGDQEPLDVSGLAGVIQHDVDDQVIEVWAGTTVAELQEELGRHGLCLPLPIKGTVPDFALSSLSTVGGLLAMNLPHALSAQCGGPRDWTLGITVVRADGSLAKSGSKAVKSVAGYDVHKLFIGSRGELGVVAKVNLRTFPVKALPKPQLDFTRDHHGPHFVARVLRTDFEEAAQGSSALLAADPESSTVWTATEPQHFAEGWIIGPDGFRKRSAQPAKFEKRTQEVFDPERKFAPGWAR